MNLVDCYQVLGLSAGASFGDIKASYRQLARRYHPDMSAGDQRAKDKFIEITAAYKCLLNALTDPAKGQHPGYVKEASTGRSSASSKPPTEAPRKRVQIQLDPRLSLLESQLKVNSYEQLQQLLKNQRFPRAVALVEGLARRLPQDLEVTQWQAIVYQQWGRHLIREQPDKARLYLQKALRTDPHNRSLWAEVEKDFRTLERCV